MHSVEGPRPVMEYIIPVAFCAERKFKNVCINFFDAHPAIEVPGLDNDFGEDISTILSCSDKLAKQNFFDVNERVIGGGLNLECSQGFM